MLLLFWRGAVTPLEVFSGGNARIGGSPAVDAVPRIGAARDVVRKSRVGGTTLKRTPGRIG